MLEELDEALNADPVSLVFAELKDPVRRKIERYGLTRTTSPHHFYPTIESAVAACRRETGTEWAVPASGQRRRETGTRPVTGKPHRHPRIRAGRN